MFSLLPTSLIAFLISSPALAAPSTPNDLFHDIAVHAPKQHEEPVCCLRPLLPLEPVQDGDILISFEDWKAKQFSIVTEREPAQASSQHKALKNLSESTAVPDAPHPTQAQESVIADGNAQENGNGAVHEERLAPHFRIPLTDRFNYASLDCSAHVHGAHKSAKSASSILSSKKDRYMLSPCAEEKQYVIVELCEDIRVDTVQLANYEFFSGVFKDFSVSVAKTIAGEWRPAGTFRARNVRGVQSFHTPLTLRDFYRYIRVDFHSHYGSEYYCPVSLLRVYGLTHLEEWQWETWEAESRAKRSVEEASPPVAGPPEPIPSSFVEAHTPQDDAQAGDAGASSTILASTEVTNSIPVTSNILDSLQYNLSTPSSIPVSGATSDSTHIISPPKTHSEHGSHDSPRHDHLYNTSVSLSSHAHSTASDNHSSSSSWSSSSSVLIEHPQHSDSAQSHSFSSSPSFSSVRASSATPNVSSLTTISASHATPPISTGENIYRTIMNRLVALEGNTTLYARYVEEQTAGMREVLRRLTEDIGRLEGIGRAQAQLFQRSVVELEKQTRRLEDEQRQLLSRVNLLTDEVVLEKRLGIAQLCLLLTILVFMALTRGSRGEHAYPPVARGTVREWGRRTLSFSGDLVNRLRARSSTPPRVVGQKPGENEIAFPSVADSSQVSQSLSSDDRRMRRGHTTHSYTSAARKALARPHTPTNRHFVHRAAVPLSPSSHVFGFGPRPVIQRSSSGGVALGPVPKSAKRWARSAHLHEVKMASSNLNGTATPARRHSQDGHDTPVAGPSTLSRRGSEVDDKAVFDGNRAEAQILVHPEAISRSDTITLGMNMGKGKGRWTTGSIIRQPSPLRPAPVNANVVDLSSPPARGRSMTLQSEGSASEGDAWVDTDVDASECESVVDASADAAGESVRERTYTVGAVSTNSNNSL